MQQKSLHALLTEHVSQPFLNNEGITKPLYIDNLDIDGVNVHDAIQAALQEAYEQHGQKDKNHPDFDADSFTLHSPEILKNVHFKGCYLTSCDFSQMELHEVSFTNCFVANSDFRSAKGLRETSFDRSILSHVALPLSTKNLPPKLDNAKGVGAISFHDEKGKELFGFTADPKSHEISYNGSLTSKFLNTVHRSNTADAKAAIQAMAPKIAQPCMYGAPKETNDYDLG